MIPYLSRSDNCLTKSRYYPRVLRETQRISECLHYSQLNTRYLLPRGPPGRPIAFQLTQVQDLIWKACNGFKVLYLHTREFAITETSPLLLVSN